MKTVQPQDNNDKDLPQWQKDFIDSRLESYRKNPTNVLEWDAVVSEFDKEDEDIEAANDAK